MKNKYSNKSTKKIKLHKKFNKVALVHDWYLKSSFGGSEKITLLMDQILKNKFSTPDLFCITENISETNNNLFKNRKINTSFIQNLPFGKTNVQNYLPLIPFAIEQIDLRNYELIISSSHISAKAVLTSPDQLHISYIHTPMRYAWDQMNTYIESSKLSKFGLEVFIRFLLYKLRQWDFQTGCRPDYLIANSNFTAKRIKKYWGLNSTVIHPGINIKRFNFQKNRGDFYLTVNRLVPNKRIDLLINSFNKLNLPLIIIGDGIEYKRLKKLSNKNIKLLGKQNDEVVEDLMSRCRAFVYSGIEDFGMAPVEAMASGAPIIALGKGGILDTVSCITKCSEKVYPTGVLFDNQTIRDMVDTIAWFEDKKIWKNFDPEMLNHLSKKFSKENFSKKFLQFTTKAIEEFNRKKMVKIDYAN